MNKDSILSSPFTYTRAHGQAVNKIHLIRPSCPLRRIALKVQTGGLKQHSSIWFQAVACSLYVVGFGESIAALFHQDNVWIARGIAAAVIFLLLGECIVNRKLSDKRPECHFTNVLRAPFSVQRIPV